MKWENSGVVHTPNQKNIDKKLKTHSYNKKENFHITGTRINNTKKKYYTENCILTSQSLSLPEDIVTHNTIPWINVQTEKKIFKEWLTIRCW